MDCLASGVLRHLLCDFEVNRKDSCSIKTEVTAGEMQDSHPVWTLQGSKAHSRLWEGGFWEKLMCGALF